MRSACWLTAGFEGSASGSCSELLLLELSELLSSDSSSAGFGGTGASCSTRGGAPVSKDSSELSFSGGAAVLLAPAVLPAPGGGSQASFSAPSLSAPPAFAESVCHECSSSSTHRALSGTLVGVFPTTLAPSCGAGPPAAGCHLPVPVRGI